jgi:hypothetical protein
LREARLKALEKELRRLGTKTERLSKKVKRVTKKIMREWQECSKFLSSGQNICLLTHHSYLIYHIIAVNHHAAQI